MFIGVRAKCGRKGRITTGNRSLVRFSPPLFLSCQNELSWGSLRDSETNVQSSSVPFSNFPLAWAFYENLFRLLVQHYNPSQFVHSFFLSLWSGLIQAFRLDKAENATISKNQVNFCSIGNKKCFVFMIKCGPFFFNSEGAAN